LDERRVDYGTLALVPRIALIARRERRIRNGTDSDLAAAGRAGRPAAAGAASVGRLALAMLEHVGDHPLLGRRKLSLRIGIHSGPATAGIIGDTRVESGRRHIAVADRLDLLDAVALAERIEVAHQGVEDARWTLRLLADKVVERKIVATAHFNTVGRVKKRHQAAPQGIGLQQAQDGARARIAARRGAPRRTSASVTLGGTLPRRRNSSGSGTGKPVTILLPSDRQDEERAILQRISRGRRVDHYETVRQRKDGGLIDVSLTVSPVRDSKGQIIGASKIARDITARKHREAQMGHKRWRAFAANPLPWHILRVK
jgi:PAS domain-containing protein